MKTQILIDFKKNLINFFDELREQFPEEGSFLIIRIFLKDQIPIEHAMNEWLYKLSKDNDFVKNMIKNRNDEIFLTNDIFTSFNKDVTASLKKIWTSDDVDDDDREIIWRWMDMFVLLSEKYKDCN